MPSSNSSIGKSSQLLHNNTSDNQPSASAHYPDGKEISNNPVSETEQSDDDDAEERLDCVHDIHSQRQRQ